VNNQAISASGSGAIGNWSYDSNARILTVNVTEVQANTAVTITHD
jgi:hypothetical protein